MSEWALCHDQVQSALNIKQLGGFAMLQFDIIEMIHILLLVLSSDKFIWCIDIHQKTNLLRPCLNVPIVPTLSLKWSRFLQINDIRFKAWVGNGLGMLRQLGITGLSYQC